MRNVYAASDYAAGYAELGWNGTYFLVRRDLPELLLRHAPSGRALDFGCGAGRSTRLLSELGYDAEGIDISASMIDQARRQSPGLSFRTIEDGDFATWPPATLDLVLACFPFDNIAGRENKTDLLRGLGRLLKPSGVLVNVVSSVEIYVREWASFTTSAFPENLTAQNEDIVRIVTRDFEGAPVCDDVRCDDAGYHAIYSAAGLRVLECLRPLGYPDEPVAWVSELEVSPWALWALAPGSV